MHEYRTTGNHYGISATYIYIYTYICCRPCCASQLDVTVYTEVHCICTLYMKIWIVPIFVKHVNMRHTEPGHDLIQMSG